MVTVNTLVITGYGTNSHLETAHTARLAGSDRADVVRGGLDALGLRRSQHTLVAELVERLVVKTT